MIVAVVNEKGGVAKTTTAVNLACALTMRGQNVVVADIDTQDDALAYEDSEPSVRWRKASHRTLEGCLIREGLTPRSTDSEQWGIVDCPGELGPRLRAGLQVASVVIVPVDSRLGGVRGLAKIQATIATARSLNPTVRLRVLLTMWKPRSSRAQRIAEAMEMAFGPDLLQTRIRFSELFEDAEGEVTPLVRWAPRSVGAQDYRDLAEEILSLCH